MPAVPAEVAVDLEGRVRVEHIGIGSVGAEQERQDLISVLRILQPRPET